MKKIIFLIIVVLAIPILASAQGSGFFIRTDCTTITSPVTNQTICWDTTLARLRYYNGTTWLSVTVTSIPIPIVDGGTATETATNARISLGLQATSGSTGKVKINTNGSWRTE